MTSAMRRNHFVTFMLFIHTVSSYLLTKWTPHGKSRLQQQHLSLKAGIRSTDLADLCSTNIKFAICGGGAFSIAMAQVLAHRNIPVNLLVRNQTVADHINEHHRHPKYLTDCVLPTQLWATSDPMLAFDKVKYVIHAVPMQQSRSFLISMKPYLPISVPIVSVTKGMEESTFCLMDDILAETLGSGRRTAFLSGPSCAREIINGQASAVVIASTSSLASELSEIMSSEKFRCHTSRDVKGLELGGAVKNVIALAAGMCEGLGLGMNAMSSLVTSGCQEMSSMGELFGADRETFSGLAGVGDTFGTCMGPLSRNRQIGVRLAKGETLKDILATSDTAEGVSTSLALQQLLMTKVEPRVLDFKFPIISGVASVIKGKITPRAALDLLMDYPVRNENKGH